MFSKAKAKDQDQAQTQQVRRNMKSAPSIISADMTVTGSISTSGDIQIDGKVEGDVRTGTLTIGEKATVHGEVICEQVEVRGRVIGSVRANRVQLSATSHVEGDILHSALAVETGAFFEGNCRHSDNPTKDSLPSGRSAKNTDLGSLKNGEAKHDGGGRSGPFAREADEEVELTGRRGKKGAPVEAQSALKRLTEAANRR